MSEQPTNPAARDARNEGPVIDSRAGFAAALQWGFDTAIAQRARRIVCCDQTFEHWAWDDAARLQALVGWFRLPQRELVLLARGYDELLRRFPRFNAWRADWSHAITGWVAPEELGASLPSVLVADRCLSVHLIDAEHWRGRASADERRAHQWCDEIDAVLQRSERGMAVKTLGL